MSEPVAILLTFCLITFTLITVVWLVIMHRHKARELLSRERLAALERGVDIPWESQLLRPRTSRPSLRVGLILTGAGFGLASATRSTRCAGARA